MRFPRMLAAGALLAVMTAPPALAAKPEQTSFDGLELRPSKKIELFYARPGATFGGYTKVALLDCPVAFRKNWQRDQNSSGLRVSSADMDRIRKSLSGSFREIFSEELAKGGYTLATEAGEDVLILKPALVDLDVQAPDTASAGRSRSFSTSAGSMTLILELYDGATGEIIGRAIDRERARDNGRMMWQTSVTNRSEANRMLRKWADLAVQGLEHARSAGVTQE